MKNQSTASNKTRYIWIVLAVTSGLVQFMLILCGGMYLMDIYDYPWIKYAVILPALWSLVWPIYSYVGMNKTYRELLEASRKGLFKKQAEQVEDPDC